MATLVPGQFVKACKGSLRRLGMDQIGIGQLHWSTANYQPLQERALWDGLVALHDQVPDHWFLAFLLSLICHVSQDVAACHVSRELCVVVVMVKNVI